jgi:chorismate mutase/prephenate dehydrogenase
MLFMFYFFGASSMGDQRALITAYRDEITSIDEEIFRLIKKREQLSSQIGEAKRELNIPDRDMTREKAVFDHALAMARSLDLPELFAAGLQQLIIDESLSRQQRDRIRNNTPKKILKIAVIGGAGRMGGWLSQFLADSGHEITIIDKIRPTTNLLYNSDISPNINKQDLIIIATPIRTSVEILEKLGSYNLTNTTIFDVSSVKSPVYESLCKLRDNNIAVTSIHPMFGPSVQLFFGKHIILTSLGVKRADMLAGDLFKSTALTVLNMSIDQHDQTMSYVLSLSHLVNIIFVLALEQSSNNIANLELLASPTFTTMLTQARKVFDENPHLYYEIQAFNNYNKKSYDQLKRALTNILSAVTNNDEENFVAMMTSGREFLRRAT